MDAKAFIQLQISGVRRLYDAATQEMTEDQLNWTPPGTANPISLTLMHMLAAEDFFINRVLQDQPRLWETGGWSERVGLASLPTRGQSWDAIKGTRLPVEGVLAYGKAVHAASDAYVERVTPDELDRIVMFAGNERPAALVLATLVTHNLGHTGEIAALRGVQGAKGLPF